MTEITLLPAFVNVLGPPLSLPFCLFRCMGYRTARSALPMKDLPCRRNCPSRAHSLRGLRKPRRFPSGRLRGGSGTSRTPCPRRNAPTGETGRPRPPSLPGRTRARATAQAARRRTGRGPTERSPGACPEPVGCGRRAPAFPQESRFRRTPGARPAPPGRQRAARIAQTGAPLPRSTRTRRSHAVPLPGNPFRFSSSYHSPRPLSSAVFLDTGADTGV